MINDKDDFLSRSILILMENGLNHDYADVVSECLYVIYSHKSRKFFNLQHILAMLRATDNYYPGLDKNSSLMPSEKLAILFHDIVKLPNSTDNEEKSIELMISFMSSYNVMITEYCWSSRIIRAMKYNQHTNDDQSTFTVLDLDHIYLSDPYEIFKCSMESIMHDLGMINSDLIGYLEALSFKNKLYYKLHDLNPWAKNNISKYVAEHKKL